MIYSNNPKGKKLVKEAIKNLINLGFLLAKLSTGEIHASLNSDRAKEINLFLEKVREEVEENGI